MDKHKTVLDLLEKEEQKRTLQPWETALKNMKPLIRQLRVFCTSENGSIDVQLFSDFLIQEIIETIVSTAMELDDTKCAPRYVRAILSHLEEEKKNPDSEENPEVKVTFNVV